MITSFGYHHDKPLPAHLLSGVVIYDAPEGIDDLCAALGEDGMPPDVALCTAARIGAAAELRTLAAEAERAGSFAIALGKLRARADYLDPDAAR